jgi:hypothetical protein
MTIVQDLDDFGYLTPRVSRGKGRKLWTTLGGHAKFPKTFIYIISSRSWQLSMGFL